MIPVLALSLLGYLAHYTRSRRGTCQSQLYRTSALSLSPGADRPRSHGWSAKHDMSSPAGQSEASDEGFVLDEEEDRSIVALWRSTGGLISPDQADPLPYTRSNQHSARPESITISPEPEKSHYDSHSYSPWTRPLRSLLGSSYPRSISSSSHRTTGLPTFIPGNNETFESEAINLKNVYHLPALDYWKPKDNPAMQRIDAGSLGDREAAGTAATSIALSSLGPSGVSDGIMNGNDGPDIRLNDDDDVAVNSTRNNLDPSTPQLFRANPSATKLTYHSTEELTHRFPSSSPRTSSTTSSISAISLLSDEWPIPPLHNQINRSVYAISKSQYSRASVSGTHSSIRPGSEIVSFSDIIQSVGLD